MASHTETHSAFKRQAQRDHAAKVRHHFGEGGSASNTEDMIRKAVGEHESNDHPGKAKTRLKFKDGGSIDGEASKSRLDRKSGGRTKSKSKGTNVNIVIAHPPAPPGAALDPNATPSGPMPHPPMPPMAPPAPPPGGPPMGPPRPPMMPPPGAGPGGPPMPMRARGGRAYAKGGEVHMDAGAGSGEGRLEKIAEYGANSKKMEGQK